MKWCVVHSYTVVFMQVLTTMPSIHAHEVLIQLQLTQQLRSAVLEFLEFSNSNFRNLRGNSETREAAWSQEGHGSTGAAAIFLNHECHSAP